jgi:hypothetical protein
MPKLALENRASAAVLAVYETEFSPVLEIDPQGGYHVIVPARITNDAIQRALRETCYLF